jgi:hypothetical protein
VNPGESIGSALLERENEPEESEESEDEAEARTAYSVHKIGNQSRMAGKFYSNFNLL